MRHFHKLIHIALFILSFNVSAQAISNNKETFNAPDFNYPQTVIKNADAKLEQAIADGNGELTALALIQSSLAKSMISSDTLPNIISSIDSVILKEQNPDIKAILYLLEANIINSYYQNNRYKISRRDAPPRTSLKINEIFEWNAEDFKSCISSLLDKALNFEQALKSSPVTKYPDLIKINSISIDTYPTLYDFIAYKSIAIYNSWGISNGWNPFAKAIGINSGDYNDRITDIYDKLITFHKDRSKAYLKALLNKLAFTETDSHSRLDSLYTAYRNTPDAAPIIMELVKKIDNKKEQYTLLKSYTEQFPESPYTPQLKMRMLSLERPGAAISFSNQYTSQDSIKLVCSIENINKFSISIYKVKDNVHLRNINFGKMNPIYETIHTVTDSIPFCDTLKISMPPLNYGTYTAVIHALDKKGGKIEQTNNYFSTFIVSDITSFCVFNNYGKNRRIFAMNAITGMPYKGVAITSSTQGTNPQKFVSRTNSNGFILANDTKYNKFFFSKVNDNSYTATIYKNYYNHKQESNLNKAQIFTDLAIYRPGETMHLTAVCYRSGTKENTPLKRCQVSIILTDAVQDTVATVKSITDEQGRVSHDFIIPDNRMNGEFFISVKDAKNDIYYGHSTITVSEYKSPTFYIEFTNTQNSYSDKGDITLKGIAKTFSDMPLGNIPVKCTLSRASLYSMFSEIASINTITDENGMFSVTLNTSALKEKEDSPFNTYRLTASATDKAGDTQSGSTGFNIGKSIVLSWEHYSTEPLNIEADKEAKLPISIKSNIPEEHGVYKCSLSLKEIDGDLVKSIPFLSDKPTFDFSDIPSGEYMLSVEIDADSTVSIKDKKLIIFRTTDKQCPTESVLWTPFQQLECNPGEDIEILLGSSIENSLTYYTVSYKDGILKEGWKKLPKGVSRFKYTMPVDAEASIIIQFYCVKGLKPYKYNIAVTPRRKAANVTLSVESFRDKVTAGDIEKWELHLTENGKAISNGAIIATMTDKAINMLRDNRWYFNPQLLPIYTSEALTALNRYDWGGNSNRFNWKTDITEMINELRKYPVISAPQLYLYNQNFFASSVRKFARNIKMTSADERYNAVYDMVAVAETEAMSADAGMATGAMPKQMYVPQEKDNEQAIIKSSPIKTVFWKPELVTNNNGNADIVFTVPNYNTTWLFQAISYDKDMNTAGIFKEIVSNKPIMVKSNMPRFLRQGDTALLSASVQNATDSLQHCTATIEIFNPLDNAIYKTQAISLSIKPKGSDIASILYTVPDTISLLAFRIKASNGTYSDGEQVQVPVLQNISPVIESTPFYIQQGDTTCTIKLPTFPGNANITLEYCDNPVWYVATALPSIKSDDNTTATQLAHSIFSNIVAHKIVKKYPQIIKAIEYWKEKPQDSVLISMLEKNPELKIGEISASPFLPVAKEQTLRMYRLGELFDNAETSAATDKLIRKLGELQHDDGGFSWFKYPGATSSPFMTLNVLQILGKAISDDTVIKNSLERILNDAVKYIDNAIIEQYNRHDNKLSYSGYLNYAYTRSMFLNIPMSVTVKELYGNITNSLMREWKRMNIVDKTFTAITLANFGKTEQAKPILESITQYSTYRPTTGRYWDNFSKNRYYYADKIALTSTILQAYQRIDPLSVHIEQIKEWLLLEKQTTDWGNSSMAADAVSAILSTDSGSPAIYNKPIIHLNGKILNTNMFDKILGYGKIKLKTDNASRNNVIKINRDSSTPAWGAVYSCYSAPMKDIKAASSSGLSIKKEIINCDSSNDSIKTGDKIRIRLVIKNSRNLEYVTVSDERATCLEPINQTSEYHFEDGLGYYMEVKDSKTNLFFNYLPKGTHVITYDTYVTNCGDFNCGIATAQCQYAPQITAHSAGTVIKVE